MIEPLKYLIQPIAYERDDETGRVLREIPGQTVTVFTAEGAAQAVTEFEAALQQLQEEQDAHQQDNGRAQADAAGRSPASGLRQP